MPELVDVFRLGASGDLVEFVEAVMRLSPER